MKKSVRYITYTAMGIALYVVLSMTMKIPLISHISLDLGYIAIALMCYHFGAISGMIVAGAGCVINSLITSGWFPPGWFVGNLMIGMICGLVYKNLRFELSSKRLYNIACALITVVVVFGGICGIKTVIECQMYSIPYAVKIPKNAIAALTDSIVMVLGLLLAQHKAFNGLGKKVE